MKESTEEFFKALAKVLVTERKKQKLSQSELALKSGVDRSYISDIEREKRNPSLSVLLQIGEGLGLSLSVIMLKVEYILEVKKEKS